MRHGDIGFLAEIFSHGFISGVDRGCARAGFPAAKTPGGTLSKSTERAATTESLPIVTPGRMQASKPIQTLFPTRIGARGTCAASASPQPGAG